MRDSGNMAWCMTVEFSRKTMTIFMSENGSGRRERNGKGTLKRVMAIRGKMARRQGNLQMCFRLNI